MLGVHEWYEVQFKGYSVDFFGNFMTCKMPLNNVERRKT